MAKYLFSLMLALITGCSDSQIDFSELNIYEQSVHQKQRFKGDKKRDEERKPAEVLAFAGVKPGMQVIDLLGGGGYYTELLSYIVGESGKVYLQNNSLFLSFSAEEIDKRLRNNRLPNVVRLDSEFADMRLPAGVDMVFMGLSYHDIYVPREDPVIMADRDEFFTQLKAALKPGGKLLVIDHAAVRGSGKSAAAKLHRIDEDFARQDIESEGFTFLGALDVLRNPHDDYSKDIWAPGIMRKTDQFIHLFEKNGLVQ